MNLNQWAIKWGVPAAAVADLRQSMGLDPGQTGVTVVGESESAATAAVRLEASRKGLRVWRNNVGAYIDSRGRQVRYGLANESRAMNQVIKSGDLIGIRPVTIQPGHVGMIIGQFVSREMKAPGWTYSGTDHERAQRKWSEIVTAMGGDAMFCTGEGTL